MSVGMMASFINTNSAPLTPNSSVVTGTTEGIEKMREERESGGSRKKGVCVWKKREREREWGST